MSGRSTSVLASYNPLTDPHLAAHYSNRRRRKQLKSAGLIRKNGEIISEREWLLQNQNKEARSHMKDLLAQAVVHKALEIERNRQVDIRNQLEMMAKKERVRRIRAERSKTELIMKPIKVTSGAPRGRSAQGGRRESYQSSQSQQSEKQVQETTKKEKKLQKIHELDYSTLKMIKKEVDRNRAFHPTPSPFQQAHDTNPKKIPNLPNLPEHQLRRSNTMHMTSKSSGARLHRPEPGMIVKVRQQTLCEMKYKYIGRPGMGETAYLDPEDVVIEQQHCGGETIKVYHGLLMPGQKIHFTSRRHRGYPYSIVMYVNNIRVERISSCCEYKYKKGAKLGTGTLQFISVEGAAPCFKCNVRNNIIKDKPDPAPRPISRNDSKAESQSAPRSHQSQSDEPEISNETDQEDEVEAVEDAVSFEDDPPKDAVEAPKEPEESKEDTNEESDHDERSLTSDSSSASDQSDSSDSESEIEKEEEPSIVSEVEQKTEEVKSDEPEIENETAVTETASPVTVTVTAPQPEDEIVDKQNDDTLDEVTDRSEIVTNTADENDVTTVTDDVTNVVTSDDVTENNVTNITDDEASNSSSSNSSSDDESTTQSPTPRDEPETKEEESLVTPVSMTTPTANLLVDDILDRVVAAGDVSPVSTTSPLANHLVAETLDKLTSPNTDSD